MGFFENIHKRVSGTTKDSKTAEVYAPMDGRVIPLSEIPDEVFRAGILGSGCGIEPYSEDVLAPFDGEVIQVADTKHSVGLTSTNGIQLLIHVGMDTVDMNGKGFTVHIKTGQKVKKGQCLLSFSKKEIEKAGHPATTAIVFCEAEDKEVIVENVKEVRSGDKLMELR